MCLIGCTNVSVNYGSLAIGAFAVAVGWYVGITCCQLIGKQISGWKERNGHE